MARGKFATFMLGYEKPTEIRSEGNPNGDGMLPGVIPPPELARTAVSMQEALGISAVYASVNIINNWIGQLNLGVFKNGEEQPTPSLVAQPDTDSTQYEFIKQTITSAALTGNFYWLVTRRQSDGVPIALEVLNPLSMDVSNATGKLVYRYSGFVGGTKEYSPRNIVHGKTFEVPGRLTGLSPIEANGAGLAGELLLRRYSEQVFGDGKGVRQHFSVAQNLDPVKLAAYIESVKTQKATGSGDLVTDSDTTINTLQLSPADTEYLSVAQFSKTEIAVTWFGIPAGLVGASVDGNSMTYSNLQTDARLFVTNTLMGYMRPIEEAFTALLPRGTVVQFKTDALLRADTQDRYESYNTAITAGFMTANEARALEGWAPLQEPDATPAANPPAEPIEKENDLEAA